MIGTRYPHTVFSPIPTVPSGAIEKGAEEYGEVVGQDDHEYVITDGTTLTIQRLTASGEDSLNGNICELWYDPNGDKTGMTLICVINTDGNFDYKDLNNEYTGNGTRRIVMRRRRLAGGVAYIYAKWQGYEE